MSRGLPFRLRGLTIVFALAISALGLVLMAGCGGGEDDDFVDQPKPRYMVPGQAADSTSADTSSVTSGESSYEAGTLTGSEGVTQSVDSQGAALTGQEAEIKPTKDESNAAPVTTTSRPGVSTSGANGSDAYSLQLGSFTNLDNARQQADRIKAMGYSPVIEETVLAGQTYHRVLLRNVGDMAKASRLGEHIHSELDIAYLVRRAK
jgi:cell division septation protein DedD